MERRGRVRRFEHPENGWMELELDGADLVTRRLVPGKELMENRMHTPSADTAIGMRLVVIGVLPPGFVEVGATPVPGLRQVGWLVNGQFVELGVDVPDNSMLVFLPQEQR